MSQVKGKNRVQFRCRPVRSNSCSNNSNQGFKTPSPHLKLYKKSTEEGHREQNQVYQKKQPVFQIPRKMLTIKKNPHIHPLTTEYYPLDTPSLVSNQSCANQTEKQLAQAIDMDMDMGLAIDHMEMEIQRSSENASLQQQQFNNLHHDYSSKATMKNNYGKCSENKEIKVMLMELADGHQEMMAMLKQIINKDPNTVVKDNPRPRAHTSLKYNKLQSSPQAQPIRQNLQINQVYNETITTASPVNNCSLRKSILRESSVTHKSTKIPSYVASMLVSVINSNFNFHPFLNTQMDLRQLISRRFQAFYMSYNYFLELLIQCRREIIGKQKLVEMLRGRPFLLDTEQTQIILNTFESKPYQNDQSPVPTYSLSQIGQKMRYFVYSRTPLDHNLIKLKIIQFKTLLTKKCQEMKQAFSSITDYEQTINIQSLEKILKEYRFQSIEIEILLAKLCVVSRNVNQIRYGLLFQAGWVDGLDGDG